MLLCALAALATAPSLAQASVPELAFTIPRQAPVGAASAAGHIGNPRGIALAPGDKRVYVAEAESNRVSVFTAQGSFLWAFGGGVATGEGSRAEICRARCFAGVEGGAPGQFKGPRGVGIDRGGDIYVVDEENFRVQKLSAAGRPLWMVGGHVNATTGGNLCRVASRDTCKSGVQGRGVGEFRDWDAGSFIAVDPSGRVFVGDNGRIQLFDSGGDYLGQIRVPDEIDVGSIAIDPTSGAISYAYSQFWGDDPYVYRLTRRGRQICTARVPGPTSLAAGPNGSTYAVSDPAGTGPAKLEPTVVRISSACRVYGDFGRPASGTNLNSLAYAAIGSNLYVGTYAPEGSKSSIAVYAVGQPKGSFWGAVFGWLRKGELLVSWLISRLELD